MINKKINEFEKKIKDEVSLLFYIDKISIKIKYVTDPLNSKYCLISW